MIHAFLLTVILGGNTISNDMYFYDIDRCNYFASQLVKRYGNYKYNTMVPDEHRATAYCIPKKVDPRTVDIYT